MVRRAVFFRRGEEKPEVIVENRGTRRTGECYYPTTGVFKDDHMTLAVEFETAALDADEELFQLARQHLTEPFPPGSQVDDDRTGARGNFVVAQDGSTRGLPKRQRGVVPGSLSGGRAMVYFILASSAAACFVVLLVGLRWFARKRRRAV